MTTVDLISPKGTKEGTVELPSEIFDVQTNVPLIHQVVVAQLAAARQGTHKAKSRGEVRGGGRKPYKQKGTGRARQGSTRAPQFAGGGVVHGPVPRDYSQRTPKKMKAAALRGALSDRARFGRVHVLTGIVTGDAPSTKAAASLLAGLSQRPNLLIVAQRDDELTLKSVRNLGNVHLLAVDQLNTYDVLCSDEVVFTQGALEAFLESALAKAPKAEKADNADKAVAVQDAPVQEAPVQDALVENTSDAPALPEGAVAPLADGSAPEGYAIKGNADSGLYHAPGGRWYDATVAEFWFADEAAAQAAGFTKAGSRAKKTTEEAK